MGALRQDGLADETVGPNITWLDYTIQTPVNSHAPTKYTEVSHK
jgi:hypothetical protein